VRALLVDDDFDFARLLREYLQSHEVEVDHVGDGQAAFDLLSGAPETDVPDIVLLDVMLPRLDGFELCRRLRSHGSIVPIIMLTARGEEDDRVVGLDLGADDYVAKPFNPRELLARIQAVLRRGRSPDPAQRQRKVVVGELVIDAPGQTATLGGRGLPLTSLELRLLLALAQRAGQTLSREELAAAVFVSGTKYDPTVDRSLDVHVSHLRQKLGAEGRWIRTVRGAGYVLAIPADS
jgi:DNA-binding response OmpR family regulator